MNTRRDATHDTFPTEADIAQRAYELFLDGESSRFGRRDYWRRAEAELLERTVRRVLDASRRDAIR